MLSELSANSKGCTRIPSSLNRCVRENTTPHPVLAGEKKKKNAEKCYANYSESVTTVV